jgi:lipopolysaccharide transport system permease protein
VLRALRADFTEMISEQLTYRELLYQMTLRDIRLRYKQTIMGFGWAMFMPLVNTAVFSVIFTRIAPLETPVPYPLFAYCGLWAWNFFSASLRFSLTSLTSNSNLVAKVYFPREIFPFSTIVVSFVDFAVGSIVLFALMAWYGVGLTAAAFWLPLVLAVNVLFTTAVALFIAMANLFYRDVKYLFELVITVWMFATAVVFPIDAIGGVTGAILAANPMTPIIDAYRNIFLLGQAPPASLWTAAAISAAALLSAWLLFHRSEFRFAESI